MSRRVRTALFVHEGPAVMTDGLWVSHVGSAWFYCDEKNGDWLQATHAVL
jgi:hypothetical protein